MPAPTPIFTKLVEATIESWEKQREQQAERFIELVEEIEKNGTEEEKEHLKVLLACANARTPSN